MSVLASPALISPANLPETPQNNTHLSLPNGLATRPECFTQPRTPSVPKFRPINRADCLEVIYDLVSEPGADNAMFWDTAKQRYPINFGLASCGVTLYASAPGGMDLFSELDVAHVAGQIIRTCNKGSQRGGLGGRMAIGPRNVFWIAVAGIA